jgi:hypothetical protein
LEVIDEGSLASTDNHGAVSAVPGPQLAVEGVNVILPEPPFVTAELMFM